MTRPTHAWAWFLTVAALAGCDGSTAPNGVPVDIQIAAQVPSPRLVGGPSSVPSAGVTITGLRMVVGQAGLGSGNQFGCIDCQGGNEASASPRLLDIPLDGSTMHLQTELASPGRYDALELELAPAGAPPGWPNGSSVEIQGSMGGATFDLFVSVSGASQHPLSAPLLISGQEAASVSAVLLFPADAWFIGAGGAALDPSNAADRANIETNVRAYFYTNETPGTEG